MKRENLLILVDPNYPAFTSNTKVRAKQRALPLRTRGQLWVIHWVKGSIQQLLLLVPQKVLHP